MLQRKRNAVYGLRQTTFMLTILELKQNDEPIKENAWEQVLKNKVKYKSRQADQLALCPAVLTPWGQRGSWEGTRWKPCQLAIRPTPSSLPFQVQLKQSFLAVRHTQLSQYTAHRKPLTWINLFIWEADGGFLKKNRGTSITGGLKKQWTQTDIWFLRPVQHVCELKCRKQCSIRFIYWYYS